MRIAVASCDEVPPGFGGTALLIAVLDRLGVAAHEVAWSQPDAAWDAADMVVIRTTWDYALHHDAFLAWVSGLPVPVHNTAGLVVWNSDKRYLAELAEDGVPVVPTTFVAPGDPTPQLPGEVVVKPTVSAGARLTGRFRPRAHDAALTLLDRIRAAGRTAMVQPFQPAVDTAGETAVVLVDGAVSHTLRKGQVLQPDQIAPTLGPSGPATVMSAPDLVRAAPAAVAELDLARRVLDWVVDRFCYVPLYLRVDMLPGPDGSPVLLELEAIEPNLYLELAPGAADRLAAAILRRAATG